MIKRLRVDPISTYLERYKKGGEVYPVTVCNGFVFLSGVPPFDPPTFAATAALFGAVGLAACLVPIRRAVAIDAATALRYE